MPEEPRPHRCHGAVERLDECDALGAGAERLDQLEIASGHLIDPAEFVTAPHHGTPEVRQPRWLQLADVAKQRAGGADRRGIGRFEAETVERGQFESAGQLLAGKVGVEFPPVTPGAKDLGIGGWFRGVVGEDDLGGTEPADRLGERLGAGAFEHELAGGKVDRREPVAGDGDQPVVPRPGDIFVVEEGAGSDRLDHGALDDPLGGPRILDLLADGDPVTGSDELAQVSCGGLDRDTGQRHPVAAGGQGDAQHPRRDLGVVVEHLVEVAHPEEEDRVGVTRLDLAVLDQEWGVGHGKEVSREPRGPAGGVRAPSTAAPTGSLAGLATSGHQAARPTPSHRPSRREARTRMRIPRASLVWLLPVTVVILGAASMAARQAPACATAPLFSALDFWVGEWTVWANGQQVGTNRISKILDGCAVTEEWNQGEGATGG